MQAEDQYLLPMVGLIKGNVDGYGPAGGVEPDMAIEPTVDHIYENSPATTGHRCGQ
jgi:hypothetical protein